MALQHRSSRPLFLAIGLALITSLLSACGQSATVQPVVSGILSFDQSVALASNGAIPTVSPGVVCGSSTATFGTELLTTSPQHAKVTDEWGEIIPGAPMMAAGTIKNFQFSQGDLPFTHPFGKDVTFDIALDNVYSDLSQTAGTGAAEVAPGLLHWEIPQGLVPHQDGTTYLDGFVPQDGDRVASVGHWITDCGHDDFHTEMHPPTFVSYARTEGTATVAHAFYVPYYETQLYTPIADLANDLTNTMRFNDPNTLTFPQYLVQELIRVGHLGPKGPLCCADRLETHMLLTPNTLSPVSWFVCAPGPRPSGGRLSAPYHFTARPGVALTATPNDDLGCVQFTATISAPYSPMIPDRKSCVLPWNVLDQQARAATGNPNLSVKAAIEKLVPPSFLPGVEKNPIVDCYDPLVVSPPGGPSGSQPVFTSADQPFPFYGLAEVSWQAGT